MNRARRRRLRSAALSGLVFPGLGQLADRHYWRALAFAGGSVALLALLLRRVWTETLLRLPTEPEALLDPALPFRLAREIEGANAGFFAWVTVGLIAFWLSSVADAWLASGDRSLDGPPGHA